MKVGTQDVARGTFSQFQSAARHFATTQVFAFSEDESFQCVQRGCAAFGSTKAAFVED